MRLFRWAAQQIRHREIYHAKGTKTTTGLGATIKTTETLRGDGQGVITIEHTDPHTGTTKSGNFDVKWKRRTNK